MVKPLVQKTAERLLALISEREYDVGDKLPNEYELAQVLDVGRSTIREAVRSLVTRNILEVRQGSGTYIHSKRGVSEDPLGFSLVKDTRKLTIDLFELRCLLEPRIAQKVAQVATDEEINELCEIVEAIENSAQLNDTAHWELDVVFHSKLAKISGNIALDSLVPIINKSIHLTNDNFTSHQMKEDMILLHRDILDAIKRRDGVAAYDAMLLHVLAVKRRIIFSES